RNKGSRRMAQIAARDYKLGLPSGNITLRVGQLPENLHAWSKLKMTIDVNAIPLFWRDKVTTSRLFGHLSLRIPEVLRSQIYPIAAGRNDCSRIIQPWQRVAFINRNTAHLPYRWASIQRVDGRWKPRRVPRVLPAEAPKVHVAGHSSLVVV